jgi:DNA-formamidopyrimidine glycosylase
MPEGHTLFRLARDLTEAFAGRPTRVTSPQGRFAADAAVLDGAVLTGAESAGKHLFVEFAGERFIHIHLGLIGRLDIRVFDAQSEQLPEPVGEVRLRLVSAPAQDGTTSYADLRGATRCDLVGADQRAEVIGRLGPDPLRADADLDAAWQRIRRSHRPIGDLLMDQAVVAGVGNVYRAEVLFRARMHPLRPGSTLRRSQFEGIWADLVALMAEGVRIGRIDTVRPEHTPEAMGREPRVDDHGGEVYVYRRHGQECHVCGARVRSDTLVGRNLFWCPRCQPAFRSRALG